MVYDLTGYFHGEVAADDLLFKHVANRNVTITAGIGSMESAPSADFDAIIKLNGVQVVGSTMVIGLDGTVTITLAGDIVLAPGDVLEVFADSSVSAGATNVATTFVASITGDEVQSYDISAYSYGLIGKDEPILYALIPRAIRLRSTATHRVSVGVEATSNPVVFSVEVNDSPIAYLILDGSNYYFRFLTATNSLVADDRLVIRAPSGDGTVAIDETLANIAISLQGEIV